MESQQQVPRSKGISGLSALLLVVVAFGAGIFVGLHPQWIPIKTTGSGLDNMTLPSGAHPSTQTSDGRPMPATEPLPAAK
jgi:hypothetical protein